MNDSVNSISAEFEALGVLGVRRQITSRAYADGKLAHAMNWLDFKDQESRFARDELIITLAREANALAARANAAAEDAALSARATASAAEQSNRLVRIANIIAVGAAITGIVAIVISIAVAIGRLSI
jgi:hypothetical protein